MNPITISAKELKPALSGLSKIISKRSNTPFNHVRMERTISGEVTLTARDPEVQAVVQLETPGQGEPLTFLVPYEALSNVAKSCGASDTLFMTPLKEGLIGIKFPVGGQIIEHQCETLPAAEFEVMPDLKGEAVVLDDSVRGAIRCALECASMDPTRPILNGVFLDVSSSDGHYAVATDGRHLLSSNSFVLPLRDSLVIPNHRFLNDRAFDKDGPWHLRLETAGEEDAPRFEITSGRWRFSGRSLEGHYPNWRAVVPASGSARTRLHLDPETLGEVIRAIARIPCHDAEHRPVGLEVAGGRCWLLGRSPSAEDWTRIEVSASRITGSDVTIFCDRRLLTKALRFGLGQVDIVDASTPLRFSSGGQQMIVMPILGEQATPLPAAAPAPRKSEPTTASPRFQPEPEAEANVTPPSESPAKEEPSRETPEQKPALDAALLQIESLKVQNRETLRGLQELNTLLKEAAREQRANEKEVHAVRQTLRSLQSVRI